MREMALGRAEYAVLITHLDLGCAQLAKTINLLKFYLFLFCFHNCIANQEYGLEIQENDKIFLENFIYKTFFRNHFIYPLHGIKPVSLAARMTALKPHLFNTSPDFESGEVSPLEWKVWKHYEKKLLGKNFILSDEPSLYSHQINFLFFINKKEFIKCCKFHCSTFENLLGKSFDPEMSLSLIEKGDTNLLEILKNSDHLLGILLGYGDKNSEDFERSRFHMGLRLKKVSYVPYQVEMHKIVGYTHPLIPLKKVCFRGLRNSEETDKLADKYLTSHSELLNTYRGGDKVEKLIRILPQL